MIYKKYIEQGHDCDYYGGDEQGCRMARPCCYKMNLAVYQRNNPRNLFHPFHPNNGLLE